jgi:hypothetical protein
MALTKKHGREADGTNYPVLVTPKRICLTNVSRLDEKAEDKAKLDKEFKDKQKQLQEKLTKNRSRFAPILSPRDCGTASQRAQRIQNASIRFASSHAPPGV